MRVFSRSPGASNVFKIVKMIMERNFQPVIIFSFSKKECEAYALQVSKLDFNGGESTFTSNHTTLRSVFSVLLDPPGSQTIVMHLTRHHTPHPLGSKIRNRSLCRLVINIVSSLSSDRDNNSPIHKGNAAVTAAIMCGHCRYAKMFIIKSMIK